MTATLFRHLNKQGYKFSIMTTGISSHIRYLLEEKGIRMLSLSLLLSKDSIKSLAMQWSVFFFYLSSKRNRKFKHLVQTKLMGKNIITNIMKVSVAVVLA